MTSVRCRPHLDAVLGGPAHRQEVRHDVGQQVRAHPDRGVIVILQQTARQLHRFNLRNKTCGERNGEKEGGVGESITEL